MCTFSQKESILAQKRTKIKLTRTQVFCGRLCGVVRIITWAFQRESKVRHGLRYFFLRSITNRRLGPKTHACLLIVSARAHNQRAHTTQRHISAHAHIQRAI